MASNGYNSILFDIFSILDMELSVVNFLINEYSNQKLDNFDLSKISGFSLNKLKFLRMNGIQRPFGLILKEHLASTDNSNLLKKIYMQYEKEILEKYAITTDMVNLINGYKKAGEGTIKTTIHCDNSIQKRFVLKIFQNIDIELCKNEDIDTEKYTRFVVGDCKTPLMYNLQTPKSILVINFRENFSEDNISLLDLELVITLGDIHNIEVIQAYNMPTKING